MLPKTLILKIMWWIFVYFLTSIIVIVIGLLISKYQKYSTSKFTIINTYNNFIEIEEITILSNGNYCRYTLIKNK